MAKIFMQPRKPAHDIRTADAACGFALDNFLMLTSSFIGIADEIGTARIEHAELIAELGDNTLEDCELSPTARMEMTAIVRGLNRLTAGQLGARVEVSEQEQQTMDTLLISLRDTLADQHIFIPYSDSLSPSHEAPTCRPGRDVPIQTLADLRNLLDSIAEKLDVPDSLKVTHAWGDFVNNSGQAAVDAARCEIQRTVWSLLYMGDAFFSLQKEASGQDRDNLGFTQDITLGGLDKSYSAEVQLLRNEYIRIIADAFYTGCDCTDPDGKAIIEGLRDTPGISNA